MMELITITLSIDQWRAVLKQIADDPASVGIATLVAIAKPSSGTGTHRRW